MANRLAKSRALSGLTIHSQFFVFLILLTAKPRDFFDDALQVPRAQVGIPPHQSSGAVAQAGRNIRFGGSRHGQPAGKGVPQSMPNDILQLRCLDGWQIGPVIEVNRVDVRGRVTARKHPFGKPAVVEASQDVSGFLIQRQVLNGIVNLSRIGPIFYLGPVTRMLNNQRVMNSCFAQFLVKFT